MSKFRLGDTIDTLDRFKLIDRSFEREICSSPYGLYLLSYSRKTRITKYEKVLFNEQPKNMSEQLRALLVYTEMVIKDEWDKAEDFILKHDKTGKFIYDYALVIKRERWYEGEKALLRIGNFKNILDYLRIYPKWKEGIEYIKNTDDPDSIAELAKRVLKARIPEKESIIRQDGVTWFWYTRNFELNY